MLSEFLIQAFEDLKNTIIKINNWDYKKAGITSGTETGDAWLRQNSRVYHTDAQWDLSEKVKKFNLLIGADARVYEVIPDGNNFVDFQEKMKTEVKLIKKSRQFIVT